MHVPRRGLRAALPAVPAALLAAPLAALLTAVVLPAQGTEAAVEPAATSLSIGASPWTVTYGQTSTISGRLVAADTSAPLADQPVELWRKTAGATTYALVTMARTDAGGRVRFVRKPAALTTFQLRYDGDTTTPPGTAPDTSEARTISVRPRLTALLSRTAVRVGRTVTISGALAPAHAGGQIRLDRYYSGAWHQEATRRLSKAGGYSFSVTPSSAGFRSYRVRKPAHADHLEAIARPARLDVFRMHSYVVRTRGSIKADMDFFRATLTETYADARGWVRGHHRFRRVGTGGDFAVVMSEARYLPTYAPICSSMWSCRAGRYVVINQDRWRRGSPYFTGDLRQYRQMVINHETGHWLGSGHHYCSGAGRLAPVMQQQSKGMQGCKPNAWPLAWEVRAVS